MFKTRKPKIYIRHKNCICALIFKKDENSKVIFNLKMHLPDTFISHFEIVF